LISCEDWILHFVRTYLFWNQTPSQLFQEEFSQSDYWTNALRSTQACVYSCVCKIFQCRVNKMIPDSMAARIQNCVLLSQTF